MQGGGEGGVGGRGGSRGEARSYSIPPMQLNRIDTPTRDYALWETIVGT